MGVFDRWTKKTTNNAIETVKETLNDKYGAYLGFAKIGITIGIFAFGGKKIGQHMADKGAKQAPQSLNQGYPQQPIVINNYYDRGYIPNGRKQDKRH